MTTLLRIMPKVKKTRKAKTLADCLNGIAVRTRVRDDGSCWIYAVLACLGLCDHAQPAPFAATFRRQPSTRDMLLDHAIRAWLHANETCGDDVLRVPDYSESEERDIEFFGSYGFGKWAAVALGVRVIEVSSESPNKAPRLKQEINQHREMHPNQPLAIVAMSNDIDHHYEAYVLIDQPEFALPSWLADALVKRRSSLMAWLLTQPRNDDNTTDYHAPD